MRAGLLAAVLLLVPGAALGAATSWRAVVASGDVAEDGAGLTDLHALRGGERLTVQARSTALLALDAGGSRVVARSGDPLPAPLTGTFDAVTAAAAASGGRIVFSARLNSAAAATGLFRWDGTAVAPLALDVGSVSSLAVSDGLDVVIHGTGSGIRLLPSGAAAPVTIANRRLRLPQGRRFRSFGRPGFLGPGTVAFSAEVDRRDAAVFRWTAAGGLERLAGDDVGAPRTSRALRRAPVAVGPDGQVAYLWPNQGAVSVFLRGAEPWSRPVATPGDLVDGIPLGQVLPSFLAVDGGGRIAFLGAVNGMRAIIVADATGLHVLAGDIPERASALAPGLAGTAAAWIAGGALYRHDGAPRRVLDLLDMTPAGPGFAPAAVALGGDGTLALRLDRDAVYALEGDRPRPLVRTGEVVEGVGPVLEIVRYETGPGSALGVVVTAVDGRHVLARLEGRTLHRVIADDDPLPSGRLADVESSLSLGTPFAVDGRRVVAAVASTIAEGGATELIDVRDGRTRGSLRSGPEGSGELFDTPLLAFPRGAVVGDWIGSEDGERFALVHVGRRFARPVAAVGDRTPGGGATIGGIGPVARFGRGIVFLAGLEPEARDAFFAWSPGADVRRLRVRPPRLPAVMPLQIATDGRVIATLGEEDVSGAVMLAVHQGRRTTRVATSGDPSPLGGTLSLDPSEGAMALAGGRLAVLADLVGAAVQAAVLEIRVRRPQTR